MALLKSKLKLFQALEKINPARFKGANLKHRFISNETYGSRSFIYVTVSSLKARKELEANLQACGFNVHSNYAPNSTVIAVQVSYFKGRHWEE